MTETKTRSRRAKTRGGLGPSKAFQGARDALDVAVPDRTPTPAAASRGPAPGGKVRATYHLPADLVEEARGAVRQLCGPPLFLTLAALVETGLRQELERLKKTHNKGKPWPRAAPLKGGRPKAGE
jgi:hypothetical protein